MNDIVDRYQQVRHQIDTAARSSGRNSDEVRLVAVSKTYPWDEVEPAYHAGCRDFGENRVPELLEKAELAPSDVRWHFIGTLQRKKVSKLIGRSSLIHSVDTVNLAEKISSCSEAGDTKTAILLQVNTSGESTKHGLDPEGWRIAFDRILELPGIEIQGLMTMAPFIDDERVVRECFASLRKFREELQQRAGAAAELKHLSMGMTQDFELAIAEGATLVRVGTAIFGA